MRKLNGIFGLAVLGVLIIARSEIGLAAEHALRDELRGEIQQEQDPALRAEMQHQLELMDRSGELTDRDEQRSTENRSLPTATATDPSAPVEIAKADASDVEGQVDRVDVQEQKEIIRHLHKGTKPDEQAIADAFELSGEQAQTLKALPLEQLEPELERMHIKEEAEYWETLSEREHDADIQQGQAPDAEHEPVEIVREDTQADRTDAVVDQQTEDPAAAAADSTVTN